jgi:hypothetical protein
MAVSLIIVLLTQQSKLSPLLDRYLLMSQQAASSMGKVLSEQTTRGFNLSGSNMFTLPIQIKNQIASDMNLNNEGETVLEDKINALNETASHRAGQTSLLTKGNNVTKTPTGTGGNVLADSTMAYSETTTTSNKNTTNNNSVFDNNGNIKGTKGETTSANLLATALGATALAQDENPLRPNADQNILLGFFGISLVLLFFVLKKQMAYSAQKTKALGIDPHNFINDTEEQKVLQVDQKTDGTVVLCLQGKEYKVSKPELDSESDQFIERLMGLVQEDVKEIDYDALSDSTIRLSAPLSKLVTRLGFVGIKRDLFFPRTSKNRVLFRRYLTEQDLISMNLTADQISREFLSNL